MRISDRWVCAGQAVVSAALLATGLTFGEVFRLQPCYWCSFQRLLYILLAVLGVGGFLLPAGRRFWGGASALLAFGGVLAAGWQSWMQFAPQDVIECGFGDPTLTERLVDWLGSMWPSMFMVTGLCKEKDWVFLGLSLANWSVLCFALLCLVGLVVLLRRDA